MSIAWRNGVAVADLREMVPDLRLSMRTRDKDTARVLHNELEQRVLRGEKITSQLVKSLLAALTSPRAASVAAALGTQVLPVAVTTRKVAGVTLVKAFQLAKVERETWRASKAFGSIQGNFDFVAAHFGLNRALDEITSADVTGYKAAMLEAGLSPSTINQRLSILSVLFDVAEELEYPVVKPRMKFVKVRPGRKRILSRDEERTVCQWFTASKSSLDAHMTDLTVCLIDTGFRLSEMLHLDKGSVQWDTGRALAWETKADLPRAVPMTKRVRAILQRRFNEYGATPFGMLTVFSADHRWSEMRKATGYASDKQFVIHALRHTTATRLAAAGVDAFKIQQWMGHKQISTTQIYVNLAAAHLDVLKDALEVPEECATGGDSASIVEVAKNWKSLVDQVAYNAETD